MKVYNLDRLFLMHFKEVYLFDCLKSHYRTSIQKGSKINSEAIKEVLWLNF